MQVPINVSQNNQNMFSPRPQLSIPRPSFSQDSSPSIPGFYISSEEEIKPRDVPMDGSISFFPYKNLSKIVVRQWDSYGNIESLTYILDKPEQGPEQTENPLQTESREPGIIETLNNLNQGLASTFTTFAEVLRDMRNDISNLVKHFEEEDGRG